jgi:AcrR family transcriptional regulator
MAEGLRERKKALARKAFIDAANKLFAEQGFEVTTVRQIAEAANMSTRTFFRYFQTKDDIVFAETQGRIDELRKRLSPYIGAAPDFAALRVALLDFAGYVQDREEEILSYSQLLDKQSHLSARRAEAWHQAALALADEMTGADAGPGEATRVRLLTQTATVVFRNALDLWREEGPSRPFREVVDESFDTLIREVKKEERSTRLNEA